jgi:predicted DNA-binding antitoxin AbrB/MazE fold protein
MGRVHQPTDMVQWDITHREGRLMSHVVEATYVNGILKLEQPLPFKDQEKVRVTVERLTAEGHSVMDIEPVSLGQVHHALSADDDLLGEMLEGR